MRGRQGCGCAWSTRLERLHAGDLSVEIRPGPFTCGHSELLPHEGVLGY